MSAAIPSRSRGCIVLVCALAARIAAADPSADKPEAVRLFEEGRAALAAGQLDAACDKFDQSLRKDPRAVGTLLNLALCNEQRGKLASALKLYTEALDRATEANLPGQKKAAQDKVMALSPRVPIVTIHFVVPPLDGTKLLVDDGVVAVTAVELAVDPGHHEVVVTAPGRLPYSTGFDVAESERHALALPALEVPRVKTVVRKQGGRRTGKIVTIAGGAVVLTSVVMAGIAKHRYDLQFDGAGATCGGIHGFADDGRALCTVGGQARVDSARTLATEATIVGGVGLAALATGIVLWLAAPSDDASPRLTALGDASSLGLAVSGSF